VPTGTYTGKLKSGAKISFKVVSKGKAATGFKVAGTLPWKCQDPQYGDPGTGPFTIGPWNFREQKYEPAPIRSGNKIDWVQRGGSDNSGWPTGWIPGAEMHAKLTDAGAASGTVSLSGRYETPPQGEDGDTDSTQCATLGVKFTAKRKK
jgi:hypothetical protein